MLDNLRRSSTPPQDLFGIIAHVRNRWRMKLALRGAVALLGVAFGLFVLAAYGLETVKFTTTSIIVARVGLVVGFIAAVLWFVVRPLRRQVTDEQVALYLEEHEPALQATLLSAVESSRNGITAESEALVRKVVEQAIDACVRMDAARRADQAPLKKWAMGLGGLAVAAVLVVLVGPAFLRHAASALLLVSRSIEAAVPYRLEVAPGDATVPKGADQVVKAKLHGFNSEEVVLMARRTPTSNYEEVPLVRNEDGSFDGMLFDVLAPLDYYVTAGGVRSDDFLLKVVDVPYVQKLDLEYHYPAYTGLEVEKIEDGGDIAVLKGTQVRVHITPTMKTPGGQITINDKQSVPLTLQADGTLTAAFTVTADGSYRVELQTPAKERVAASPQYTIDTLEDRAPTVSFRKPGRDTSVSSIEELFAEASAEDDYGVRNLELVYSVNGGPEKVVKLFNGDRRLPEVSAGHTFYLEELGVQPGDSVSYFARATDNDAVGGGKQTTSDLYFLRVRPFRKDFRQAQSQGGGGGGGGGGGQVEALSEQQRQIISATHNVNRDKKGQTPQKLRDNSKVVELAQSKLREQVEGLLTRMNSELVQRDPAFAKIGEMLPQAVAAMKEAEGELAQAKPDVALKPENKALQILQKAEEEYETQIAVQRGQQGGGGGGGGAMQQELADLFEQDLDQLASRYESASQASEQQADQKVDEMLERLKELARRQQQQAESEARRRALQGGGGGGGASAAQQRAMAEQLEEMARQLERLSREEQRPEAAQAAQDLRAAADALRRSAAGDSRAQGEAAAAADKLRQAQRSLERGQTQRTQQAIEDAIRRADQLAGQQREIADQARKLPQGAGRQEAGREIAEDKGKLEQGLRQLESDISRAARDASREEREASRRLSEAADEIRDNQLPDLVRYAGNLIRNGGANSQNQIDNAERAISEGIDDVRDALQQAQRALGAGQQRNAQEERAERARRLAQQAESLAERTRERAQQGQQGRDGQQGQGQQARNGQQGQGQQGREGQGQQGQQGQGQGQQGQQGQGQGQGQQGQGQGQGQGQNAQNGQGGGDGRLGEGLRNGGFDRGGGYSRGGVWNGTWGGWWDGARLSEEDIRQLRNEARQLDADARELLGRTRGVEVDPRELEQVMQALRQMQDPRVYQNVAELARLQSIVAEGLKRFEFGLRRKVEGEQNALALSGGDESPEAYKKANEEYFRSLSKGGK